jgi:hypothetical protein
MSFMYDETGKSEKRRNIMLGLLIAGVIIASLLYFFWGSVLNRGTLAIEAEAPFSVEVFLEESRECGVSPCELKKKPGEYYLIFSKEGHKNILTEAEVSLWRTTNLDIKFEIVPTIEEVAQIPLEEDYQFEIVSEGRKSKLIAQGDPLKRALVYFKDALRTPVILGGEQSALIQEEGGAAYFVNLSTNKRQVIDEEIGTVLEGKWSESGRYLVFSIEEDNSLHLFDSDNLTVEDLALATGIQQISWTHGDSFVFVSEQGFASAIRTGGHGNDYIDLIEDADVGIYLFGRYHSDEKTFTRISDFQSLSALPDQLVASKNGELVYFRVGDQNFRIILRKF